MKNLWFELTVTYSYNLYEKNAVIKKSKVFHQEKGKKSINVKTSEDVGYKCKHIRFIKEKYNIIVGRDKMYNNVPVQK